MKHFKLTETTKQVEGVILYQIELIADCVHGKKGDKGGWVESLDNLEGNAWVSGNAMIFGDAKVYGNAMIFGDAKVYGDAMIFGNAWVSGDANVYGYAKIYGDEFTASPLQIQGSKHFINECKKGYLRIGCIENTYKDWQDNFMEIGRENDYNDKEIEEYKLYIDLAISLSKLSEK